MEARVTDLEMKLTFLEKTVEELNEVIFRQDKAIEALKEQQARLEERLEPQPEAPQKPPPHY